jgi:hypothetical protein
MALQLQKIDSLRKDMLQRSSHGVSDPGQVKFFRQAVIVQFSVGLMILFCLLTVISLLALEIRALLWRTGRTLSGRVMCLMVDYFPSALLAVSLIFLLNFRPFARHFEQYHTGDPSIWYSRFLVGTLSLMDSARGFSLFFSQGWVLTILGLAVLAVLIVARGLIRRAPVA